MSIFPWSLGVVCVQRGVLPQRRHSTAPRIQLSRRSRDLPLIVGTLWSSPLNPKPLMVEQRHMRVYRFNLAPCIALFSPIRAPLRVHWADIRVVNTTGHCLQGRTSGPLSGGYICQIYDSGDSICRSASLGISQI